MNKTYLNSLGETSLSQNILLYHASPNIPEKLMMKILLEKVKSLKKSSNGVDITDSKKKLKK